MLSRHRTERLGIGAPRAFAIMISLAAVVMVAALIHAMAAGIGDVRLSSKVMDAKLASIRRESGFVSSARIPKAMKEIVIADEDHDFYMHHGYSLVDMHRALRINIRAGKVKQGGSTITQQLAKNLFFTNDRTARRKVAELVTALKLEDRLTKQEILEAYLNVIDFGLGAKGIGPAARTYFGKDPLELTDGECALLAGFIPSPPKDKLTPERARAALDLTLHRLKQINGTRLASVRKEIDSVGEDQWLLKHLRHLPTAKDSG